jgi:DNA ligase (NAD+)
VLVALQMAGVSFEPKQSVKSGIFNGKTFVFTGALEHFTREEAEKIVQSLGGRTSTNVSPKTDYVVIGKDPGSKYDKAIKLGITVLKEVDFKYML